MWTLGPLKFSGHNFFGEPVDRPPSWMDASDGVVDKEFKEFLDAQIITTWKSLGSSTLATTDTTIDHSPIPAEQWGRVRQLLEIFGETDFSGAKCHQYSRARMAWLFAWCQNKDPVIFDRRVNFVQSMWKNPKFTPFLNLEQCEDKLRKESAEFHSELLTALAKMKAVESTPLFSTMTEEEQAAHITTVNESSITALGPSHTYAVRLSASMPGAFTYQYLDKTSHDKPGACVACRLVVDSGKLVDEMMSINAASLDEVTDYFRKRIGQNESDRPVIVRSATYQPFSVSMLPPPKDLDNPIILDDK